MDNIYGKIWDEAILDSEIIQEIKSAKKIPGFDINLSQDSSNWSLLMYAVCYDRKELVRYLLSIPGINVNHRSNGSSTTLFFCRQVSILGLLLSRRDLDVNMQNKWRETGLIEFCYCGREACVRELLLDARINTSIRDNKGNTARDIALKNRYSGIVKILGNSRYTTLLRIPNRALIHDIVRMIIEEYT